MMKNHLTMLSLTRIKPAISNKLRNTTKRRRLLKRKQVKRQLVSPRKKKVHQRRPPKKRPRLLLPRKVPSQHLSPLVRMQKARKTSKVKKTPRKPIVSPPNLKERPLLQSQPNLPEKTRKQLLLKKHLPPSVKRQQSLHLPYLPKPSLNQLLLIQSLWLEVHLQVPNLMNLLQIHTWMNKM